jgi:cutinase
MGRILCRGLREAYGKEKIGCQGVGGRYVAALGDSGLAKGTTDVAINEAKTMFMTASIKCPKAILTFGGYRSVSLLLLVDVYLPHIQPRSRSYT